MSQDTEARKSYFLWHEAQHFTRPETLQVLPQVTPATFLLWWPSLSKALVKVADEQRLVALALANPKCPHDVLREWFAKYPRVVASNPGLEGVDTEWFDNDPRVVARLLRNPAVGQEFPERLDNSDVRFKQAWLSNPNNDELESELGRFPQAVAANPNAGKLLRELDMSAPGVKVALSRNPSTPPDLLKQLSGDADPRVRCGVAFTIQDSTTRELLKSDPDRTVSDTACLNRQEASLRALVPNETYIQFIQFIQEVRNDDLTRPQCVRLQKLANDLGSENLSKLVEAYLRKDPSPERKPSLPVRSQSGESKGKTGIKLT